MPEKITVFTCLHPLRRDLPAWAYYARAGISLLVVLLLSTLEQPGSTDVQIAGTVLMLYAFFSLLIVMYHKRE